MVTEAHPVDVRTLGISDMHPDIGFIPDDLLTGKTREMLAAALIGNIPHHLMGERTKAAILFGLCFFVLTAVLRLHSSKRDA